MQPLMALQRLTAVKFTSCEHSTAEEPLVLPARFVAALSYLKVLDASTCEPFAAAGAHL